MSPLRRKKALPSSLLRESVSSREAGLELVAARLERLLDAAAVDVEDARKLSRAGNAGAAESALRELLMRGALSVGARERAKRGDWP